MVNLEGTGQQRQGDQDGENTAISATGADQDWRQPQKQSLVASRRLPDTQKLLVQRLDRVQLLHWMVANIPDSSAQNDGTLDAGEHLVPYLQPLPFFGTGYHRYVFLLFRHRNPVDLSEYALKKSRFSKDNKSFIYQFNLKTLKVFK